MLVHAYGDSLAVGWPDLMGIPAFGKGGSRLVPGALDPEYPEITYEAGEWSPSEHPNSAWQTYVVANPIPDTAIVSLGANDLLLSQQYLELSPFGQFPFAFLEHVGRFVDGLRALGVERVIWCTPPRVPVLVQRDACNAVYNAILHDCSLRIGFELCDWYRLLDGTDPAMTWDGLHFSEIGYQRIADILSAQLANPS